MVQITPQDHGRPPNAFLPHTDRPKPLWLRFSTNIRDELVVPRSGGL